jgi:hypothetical protein
MAKKKAAHSGSGGGGGGGSSAKPAAAAKAGSGGTQAHAKVPTPKAPKAPKASAHKSSGSKGGKGPKAAPAPKAAKAPAAPKKSDIRLKHNIAKLGMISEAVGLYRFSYTGSEKVFVGVMAQEVSAVRPDAVIDRAGVLLVDYAKLGFLMQPYDAWVVAGRKIPTMHRGV